MNNDHAKTENNFKIAEVFDFSTTEDIDKVIEKQKGRKLEIVKIDDHGIVPSRGNVFKIRKYDIDRMFEEAIKP
jgi:hypothetical protein